MTISSGRLVAREAGREAVAAPALLLRDPAHVDARRASAGDAPGTVVGLLQHARDLGLARAAHDVDEALDLLEGHVVAREVVAA